MSIGAACVHWCTKGWFFPLLLAYFMVGACAAQGPIQPFTTDGCSEFPDGTHTDKTLWRSCCVAHDLAYWRGGTFEQRRDADRALQHCVAKVGKPEIAALMLAGVRVGGSPYWPTRFRWGYGWAGFRGYRALTAEEEAQISAALQTYQNVEPLREKTGSSGED